MTKNTTKAAKHNVTTDVLHRAVCRDDTFKGPWEDEVNEAYADGRRHRARPGNEDHVVVIVTRQTTAKLLPY